MLKIYQSYWFLPTFKTVFLPMCIHMYTNSYQFNGIKGKKLLFTDLTNGSVNFQVYTEVNFTEEKP